MSITASRPYQLVSRQNKREWRTAIHLPVAAKPSNVCNMYTCLCAKPPLTLSHLSSHDKQLAALAEDESCLACFDRVWKMIFIHMGC